MDRRTVLVALGSALAIAELAHAPFDDSIIPGLVYGVVVGAVSFWVWRGTGRASVVVLGLLAVVELVLVLFVYGSGPEPAPAAVLWLFGLLTAAVTLAAVVCLVHRREPSRT